MMEATIRDTAIIFKALGDETRLKIVKLIAARGNNLCVGAIAERLGISQPAVSQHLKILKNSGLVEARRIKFHVHYSIDLNSLDNYGINISAFLMTFGAEMDFNKNCRHKDDNGCKRHKE